MMKPFTCVCLLAAAGSLLYLYQEKHAAQLVDRQVVDLMKQASQIRERTGLARAEWQMLNDPERLSQLATQHLSLQPLAPSQFAKLADLGSRLPGPVAAAPEPAAMDDDAPVAATTPAPSAVPTAVAAVVPAAPAALANTTAPMATPLHTATVVAAMVHPVAIAPAAAPVAAAEPTRLQVATVTPAPRRAARSRDTDATPVAMAAAASPHASYGSSYTPAATPVYAPIVSAFASQKPSQAGHAPVVQRASAGLSEAAYPATSYNAPAPYVGSALGMAHSTLAAPVPVAGAAELGSSYGR